MTGDSHLKKRWWLLADQSKVERQLLLCRFSNPRQSHAKKSRSDLLAWVSYRIDLGFTRSVGLPDPKLSDYGIRNAITGL